MTSTSSAARSLLPKRPVWKALVAHYQTIRSLHLRQLFADDPHRGGRFTAEAAGIYLDYSKNRITDETLRLLLRLAEDCRLPERIAVIFAGEKINVTEKRAALHIALRADKQATILLDGHNLVPEVHAVLDRMAVFSREVRDGQWRGHTGKRICHVVNIGIGGSDLGPVMAYEALCHYSQRDITFHFISQRRRHRLCRDHTRSRSRRDPVHCLFEDLHHARNLDERPHRARLDGAATQG